MDTSSPFLPLPQQEVRNYRAWQSPSPPQPSLTSLDVSPRPENHPLQQKANRLNLPNSLPTTLVTGSRQGKMLLSRLSVVSTSRQAFLPLVLSLREIKLNAFPPMQRGEWEINRGRNKLPSRNTRSRLAKTELLPGATYPKGW